MRLLTFIGVAALSSRIAVQAQTLVNPPNSIYDHQTNQRIPTKFNYIGDKLLNIKLRSDIDYKYVSRPDKRGTRRVRQLSVQAKTKRESLTQLSTLGAGRAYRTVHKVSSTRKRAKLVRTPKTKKPGTVSTPANRIKGTQGRGGEKTSCLAKRNVRRESKWTKALYKRRGNKRPLMTWPEWKISKK